MSGTDQSQTSGLAPAARISNRVVQLLSSYTGRGPTKAWTSMDQDLVSVVLRDTASGDEREITPDGVFVFIGLSPNNELVQGVLQLDEFGFIQTDIGLQTAMPGIFAAGDVRAGSTKQAASAAGEGAGVALSIRRHLDTAMIDDPDEMEPVQVSGREKVAQ